MNIFWTIFWLGFQIGVVAMIFLVAALIGGFILWRVWSKPKDRRHAR